MRTRVARGGERRAGRRERLPGKAEKASKRALSGLMDDTIDEESRGDPAGVASKVTFYLFRRINVI